MHYPKAYLRCMDTILSSSFISFFLFVYLRVSLFLTRRGGWVPTESYGQQDPAEPAVDGCCFCHFFLMAITFFRPLQRCAFTARDTRNYALFFPFFLSLASNARQGRGGRGREPAIPKKKGQTWTAEEQSAYWQAKKVERKRRSKEAAAQRRELQQKEWEELDDKERERRRAEAIAVHERRRALEAKEHAKCVQHLADVSLPVLVFDLSFAWCMTAADCRSTVSQIKFSYSALRRHAFPMRPVITSVNGNETIETGAHSELLRSLCAFEGFRRYPFQIHEAHWSTIYKKEQVVFLTADTENVLERLDPGTVYIVGAFVDHNARKFLTRDAARRHGVRMARLPLEESMEVGNRCKVLTVNHVVEVLCRYADCGEWRSAFDVLPTRRVNAARQKRSRALNGGVISVSSDNDGAELHGNDERRHDDVMPQA
ncbi:hypothetical protein MOQ_002055 [Trypanosoma cruzi marinkellei]|uniref:tRNA (guanine(9)-N(1))-methyltransferase n=1 Tax=Trypanosoma cruzi marinkellei TaxID=85056 RepID=K2P9H5_TRYCR|nr:hypothetical protein MOQ_002055 [Trypanosoma cruzi marinkellei]